MGLCLLSEIRYNLWNLELSGASPTQRSSQNSTLSPSPITQSLQFSNHAPCVALQQILWMSFHHLEADFGMTISLKFLHDPYFDSSTSLHRPLSSMPNLHFHLARSALLKFPISLIPKPPSSFGLHMFSHRTHVIFLFSKLQPHRKFLWIFFNSSHMHLGALKKDR